jgi:hypothetical protein
MVTDCEPRVGTYTITTTGPGIPRRVKNEEIYLACADHHFDYVSPKTPGFVMEWLRECGPFNVFEGEVETTPGGGRRIAGQDVIRLPESLVGLSGRATRTWEIWITPPHE